MSEARAVGGNQLLASLSRLLPFPQAPGVSSTPIRHAGRMPFLLLSYLRLRLPADSIQVAEHSLRRLQ